MSYNNVSFHFSSFDFVILQQLNTQSSNNCSFTAKRKKKTCRRPILFPLSLEGSYFNSNYNLNIPKTITVTRKPISLSQQSKGERPRTGCQSIIALNKLIKLI